jgi:hypothetical protein
MSQSNFLLIDSGDVSEHPALASLYSDEALEIYVLVEAKAEWDDYGVPGSPRWISYEDPEMLEIDINGACFTAKQFDKRFPKEVTDYINTKFGDIDLGEGEWE